MSSEVATGRRMNGRRDVHSFSRPNGCTAGDLGVLQLVHLTVVPTDSARALREARRQPVEGEVDDRRRIERHHLAHEQPADDRDAERMAELGSHARAEGERQTAEERRHRRHHDRPKAQEARLVDRVLRRLAFLALGLEREVDHHDGVLLDDADQEDDADERDDVELAARDQEGEDRADARRGQRREGSSAGGRSSRRGSRARCRR